LKEEDMRLLTTAMLATVFATSAAFAQGDGRPSSRMDQGTSVSTMPFAAPPQGMVTEAEQTAQLPPAGALRALDRQDEIFLYEIAGAGMTEVEFGMLAQKNAASAEVKEFARHMVDDHGKANARLNALVQGSEVKLPTAMNGAYKNNLAELQKLKGAAFDRAYMKAQVDDHKKVVQLLEHQASAGKDPKLKAFAAETLPTTKRHLEMAQSLQTRVQTSQR
jgi:putative membrane protein